MTEALLACGELAAARRWADDTVAVTLGSFQMHALVARAHVAMAQGENDQAERDAHAALALAVETGSYLRVPEALEVLARSACRRAKPPSCGPTLRRCGSQPRRDGRGPFPGVFDGLR